MCLIPGLTLELSKFTYKGVMSDFVSTSVLVCDFWDLGVNLWRYTPSRFYGVLFSGCYWLNNVFFPLVTFGLCTCKVLGDWRVSRRVYKFCYAMSMLDGVVISVGFSVVQIEMVSRWIFDDSISICEELKEDADDDCLVIEGAFGRGFWWIAAGSLLWNVYCGSMMVSIWKEERLTFEADMEREVLLKKIMGDKARKDLGEEEREAWERKERERLLGDFGRDDSLQEELLSGRSVDDFFKANSNEKNGAEYV